MKTFLKRFAALLGGLAALLLLFHLVENWRGKRAWTQWKQHRAALGDTFDPTPLIPPEVPDSDNFARTPFFEALVAPASQGSTSSAPGFPTTLAEQGALGDWRILQKADLDGLENRLGVKNRREILSPWDAEIAALTEAAKRPGSRLRKDYTDTSTITPLLGMRNRARMLSLHAIIALRENSKTEALEDVLTGLRVAGHFQNEPHLISQLLRIAWVNIIMQPIWEGIQEQRWSGTQLSRLQEALAQIDLVSSYKAAWQFERITMIRSFEAMAEKSLWSQPDVFSEDEQKSKVGLLLRKFSSPQGWVFQNMVRMDRYHLEQFSEVLDSDQHRIGARASEATRAGFEKTKRNPYNELTLLIAPALGSQNLRIARAQSGLDLAVIACALERHRLEKGHYPGNLTALVPTYLSKAPVDVVEGQNLHYTPGREGFTLYSLGWNLTDEGGQVAPKGSENQGDWVWSKSH